MRSDAELLQTATNQASRDGLFLAIWIFIALFADIFRRRDLSGWGKAGWILLIFLFPLIGALIYVLARPSEQEPVRPPGGSAPR